MTTFKTVGMVLLALVANLALSGNASAQSPIAAGASAAAALPKDVDPVSRFRLPLVKRDDLDDAGKKVYDRLVDPNNPSTPLTGPNAVRIYSPIVADHLYATNQYLRNDAGLGNRIAELAILNAAREANSQYEWTAHETSGLRAGLEQEIIDIVKYRKDLKGIGAMKGLGEKELIMIRLGREMLRDKQVAPETFAEGLRLFGKKGLVDVVSLMAHYSATAALLNTFEMQLAPGTKPLLPLQ